MILFKIAEIRYLLEEVWQYLPLATICKLLSVSKDMRALCIRINQTIPFNIELSSTLFSYPVETRDRFGRRRPVSESMRVRFFASMVKYFPKIVELKLLKSWIFERCGMSLLFLYADDSFRCNLKSLETTVFCDECLLGISNLTNLTELNLGRTESISNRSLEHISTLTKLKSLTITSNHRLRNIALVHLQPLINLETLNFTDTYLSDQAIGFLPSSTKLSSLTLENCPFISDGGIVIMATTAPNLTCLNLGTTYITDEGLNFLATTLTSLTHLDISNCEEVSTEGMEHLLRLPNLVSLDIRGARQRLNLSTEEKEDDNVLKQLKRKVEFMIF